MPQKLLNQTNVVAGLLFSVTKKLHSFAFFLLRYFVQYCTHALIALFPIGTIRSLRPFPRQRSNPALKSRALVLRPQISATLSPDEYINSIMARFLRPSSVRSRTACNNRLISSRVKYSGIRRLILGLQIGR